MTTARQIGTWSRLAGICALLAVALGGTLHLTLVHHDHQDLGSCAGCRLSEHTPGTVASADVPLAPEVEETSAPPSAPRVHEATPHYHPRTSRAPPTAA